MQHDDAIRLSPLPAPRGLRALLDDAVLRVARSWTRDVAAGRLRLTLPSGQTAVLGRGGSDGEATLRLNSYALFWRALRRGSIAVGESYMKGDLETDDLVRLFRFFLDNKTALERSGRGLFGVRALDKIAHRRRSNTRAGSRRNIAAHYDLGNAFYAHWLDAGMSYSSAIYRRPGETLEAAQIEKTRTILRALDIAPGRTLLEIGCGWGGLAEAAAREGAHVTAITVSREQEAHARSRIAEARLAEHVDIRFEDYRDTTGRFDRIVSVEMIEAVGEEHWPVYFDTLRERLAPGGHAVIQAITIDEASFARYRRKPDFIQRYIFPGGMLPTVAIMEAEAQAAGLRFETVERFGGSYALTLADWRARFERAWPEIAALGFDEQFRRMWLYYLTYCEAGFERGAIDVGLYKVARPAT